MFGSYRKSNQDAKPSNQDAISIDVVTSGSYLSFTYWRKVMGRGITRIGCLASVIFRINLAFAIASILYAFLPMCGASLRAPVHLLPTQFGKESSGEVEVGGWAAKLVAVSAVVDVDLELTLPNSDANINRLLEGMRVDLEFAQKRVSRPLVLPHLSAAARQLQEFIWAVPVALGLCYDEKVIRLPLASGMQPEDFLSTTTLSQRHVLSSENGDLGRSGLARLQLTPSIVVRTAHIHFQPRFAGPLGRFFSNLFIFVPCCACLIYLGRYRRSEAPTPHEQRVQSRCATVAPASPGSEVQLTFVEVQMLAKALGGSFTATFSATLAAFEEEDRATHGGKVHGQVKLDRLPMITERAEHEWAIFGEWELRNILGTTLALPANDGGLVTPDGCLQYRLWLAVTMVSLVCGNRKFAEYTEWMARHEGHVRCPVKKKA